MLSAPSTVLTRRLHGDLHAISRFDMALAELVDKGASGVASSALATFPGAEAKTPSYGIRLERL